MPEIVVAALYHFAPVADPSALRNELQARCDALELHGTLLVAAEGINGTLAGTAASLDTIESHLRSLPGMHELSSKRSTCTEAPFLRMKVRLKREIVSIGDLEIDPRTRVGTYVDARSWDALLDDPEVLVLDTRNDYEVRVGTFEGAVDPGLNHFREFPEYVRNELAAHKQRPIAMFCTGGIRCEKASSLLLREGFTRVYHLEGGILRYLETTPPNQSKWHGECFVFDRRVAVNHRLEPGEHALCYGCLEPVSPADMQSPLHEDGVCCVRCHDRTPESLRERRRERARQVELAADRGERHIGG